MLIILVLMTLTLLKIVINLIITNDFVKKNIHFEMVPISFRIGVDGLFCKKWCRFSRNGADVYLASTFRIGAGILEMVPTFRNGSIL